jgi:hypothetical protein
MRIYIIGDDGITLCREAPTAVNEGEIAVASNEELHAARISGKQLLTLWNAVRACLLRLRPSGASSLPHRWLGSRRDGGSRPWLR